MKNERSDSARTLGDRHREIDIRNGGSIGGTSVPPEYSLSWLVH